jgi:hypothetical protein
MDDNKPKGGATTQPQQLPMSQEQVDTLIHTVMQQSAAATAVAAQAAVGMEIQRIRAETDDLARSAVAAAIARQNKASAMKSMAINVGTSLGVFVVATGTMVAVNRYRNRNRPESQTIRLVGQQ